MNKIRLLTSALVVLVALPLAARGQGVQPGFLESLCATRVPPDPDCSTIAFPLVDVWAVAAIVPTKDTDEAKAAYDSLIPEPFTPPADGRREIAVLMFRLDIPMDPTTSIETDPGEGYAEGSVAIRVGFPAAEGFPYSQGWWDLAQPLNDPSQYDGGRAIGLPKYMAEAGVRRSEDGTWAAEAIDWGKAAGQADGPGSETVDGGNVLTIDWTPTDPGVSSEEAERVRSWGQYGKPLFLQTPPFDEDASHDPAMVKFTTTALVPVTDVERTPVTEYPDPIVGTATVRLEGEIPGANGEITAMPFSDIVESGEHVVAGTVAFARGYAFVTSDDLNNNQD